jgi:Fe2+ transport system protein B
MLEEFYRHLSVVPVSSMTGDGVDDFFVAVEEKRKEFERDYKPELERKRKEREQDKESKRELELGKLLRDMNVSGSSQQAGPSSKPEPETVSEAEDEDSDDEGEGGFDAAGPRDDAGLTQRYKEAMGPTDEDPSFARYLRQAGANR